MVGNKFAVQVEIQQALFTEDQREIAVRDDGDRRKVGGVCQIVPDALPGLLLVGTYNQTQTAVVRNLAALLQVAHGIQCTDQRSLVVGRTAAVQPSIAFGQCKRFGVPAHTGGTDVDVTQNTDHARTGADRDLTGVAVYIAHLHAERATQLQNRLECIRNAFAKRRMLSVLFNFLC